MTYTTISMSINDTCKTAKRILCEKLGIKESDEELYQIYEFTQKNGCKLYFINLKYKYIYAYIFIMKKKLYIIYNSFYYLLILYNNMK